MKKKNRLALLLSLLIVGNLYGSDHFELRWEGGKEQVDYHQWDKKFFKEKVQIIIEDHPNYKIPIKYEGVNFSRFVATLGRKITDDDLVIITCTDGYRPVLQGEIFKDGKAILAYKEVEPSKRITKDGRWTKVKMEDEFVSPGPYYLVWPSQKGHKHSWPYQIQSIEIKRKEDFVEFSKIKPKGATALEGFEVFKSKCIKCHSIFYIGPKGKAPDLAYVMGYRTKSYIKNRIRRGRGKMPPFSKSMISDEQITQIQEYLEEIYTQPKK